ncbi:MAG: MerR family DNA-binding transcriptional regulator [Marinosulfonomonas sp.]|nr:MerR family DNA-binding transcriptional regulator [Marinosulfonomonas sp.]
MVDGRLDFKSMCAEFDVTPRTLRYYEYIELLQPQKEGRSRYFTSREIARMKLIMRGRRFGFPLEDIRKWLAIYDEQGRNAQLEAWVGFADCQLDVLATERKVLDETIQELQSLRDRTNESLHRNGT